MKSCWIMVSAAVLCCAIPGCDTGGDAPDPPASVRRVDEAQVGQEQRGSAGPGYVGIVVRAPRSAQERLAVMSMQSLIQQYRALHGEFPASLDDLTEWGPPPPLPGGLAYEYDPASGQVQLREE